MGSQVLAQDTFILLYFTIMKRIIFASFLLLLLIHNGFAQSSAGLTITLEENNGRLTIVRGSGFVRELVIPEEINGMPVTAIGDYAFAKRDLESVVIPDSVTSIGQGAFTENRLTELVIGDNITEMGIAAFSYNRLTRITIGNGISVIPRGCFMGNRLRTVELPNTLTTIEDYAFFGNNLSGITIPPAVTSIGEGAFAGNRITILVIGDGVARIGDGAFFNNDLNRITIPGVVDEVGNRAFNNRPKASSFARRVNYFDIYGELLFSTDDSFDTYYNSQGRRSGTYIFADGEWQLN